MGHDIFRSYDQVAEAVNIFVLVPTLENIFYRAQILIR